MKQSRHFLFVVFFAVLAPFVRAYEMRTWTAMNGKTTEAAYVKYEYDTHKIVMQKRDGGILKVHRDSLCDDDWMYVMKHDPSIFEFWLKLGDCPTSIGIVKPTSDGKHTNEQTATSAGGPKKNLSFFVSNRGMMKIVYDDNLSVIIPLDRDFFRLPDSVSDRKGYHNNDPEVIVYQWESIRPHRKKISGMTEKILHIDLNWTTAAKERETRKWAYNYNQKTMGNWRSFLFDKSGLTKIAELSSSLASVDQKFFTIPRYERIQKCISEKESGVPNDVISSSDSVNESKLLGTGSGFFISRDGYFLTNYHVVQGSKNIRLHTVFGNTSATVVRVDPAVDLALLKADKRGFVPLPFASSNSATLGEDIFTIGFPMPDLQGFSPKMTKGVISSLNGIQDDDVQYQIDASIQPGNSGGPLVNNQGELVGVVVATLKAGLVAEKKGVLPQNVNYAIKKKHVLDFLVQVPECLLSIQTSNQPSTGKSATPETIEAVQNSCAMVIVFE